MIEIAESCLEYCPGINCVKRSVTPELREQAVEVASKKLGAESCQGVGYSMETFDNHICQAPNHRLDETARDLAEEVAVELELTNPGVQVRIEMPQAS